MDPTKTPGQNDPDPADDPAAKSVDDPKPDENVQPGNAGEASPDDNTPPAAPEGDEGTPADPAADDSKSRGEKRHERYIDKLGAEIRDANSRDNTYTRELFTPKPYEPIKLEEGADFDRKDLEADRKAIADNKFAEGVQTGITAGTEPLVKEMWADRLDLDSERVTTKYEELNPDSKVYNPKLEAHLVQQYIAFAGVEKDANGRVSIAKPNVRFRDFVEAEMRNLEDFATSRNAASQKDLVKQAANTGLRPNGQSRSTKTSPFDPNDPHSLENMSSEDYWKNGGREASDAYIAQRLGLKS